MIVTRHVLATRIEAYMRHDLTLVELVDWAGIALREGEFPEPGRAGSIRHILGRLSLEEVRAYGLPPEECDDLVYFLRRPQRIAILSGEESIEAAAGAQPLI